MTGAYALGIGLLIVLFLTGAFWLARLVADAPEGWQDSAGFHFGVPELPDAGRDGFDLKSLDYSTARLANRDDAAPVLDLHARKVGQQ